MHNFNKIRKMSLGGTWNGVGLMPAPPLINPNSIGSNVPTIKPTSITTLNTDLQNAKNKNIASLQDNFLKLSLLTNNIASVAGSAFDIVGSFILPDGYNGEYGGLLLLGDLAFDQASNAMMSINPLVGGIMKAGGFVSDVLTKWGGMGTDSMTKTDAILGSKLLSLTPFGMINGWGGKRTQEFSANQDTIELVGASYGGTVSNINDAVSKAGKKYGLFSNKARKKANNLIDTSRTLQNTMTNIANKAADMLSISTSMSDINHLAYGFNLNGGYDQRFIRAAKIGGKFRFEKLNREIINVDTKQIEWQPIITEFKPDIIETVEELKLGGFIPVIVECKEGKTWQPIITEFKQGGKSEEHWKKPTNWTEEKIPYLKWVSDINKDYIGDNYDLESAYKYYPKEMLERWKFAVNSSNPKFYMDYQDPNTKEYTYHLGSIVELGNGDYMFLKKGKEDTNPELHFETDSYYNGENGLNKTHNLIYEGDRYYYRKKTNEFKSGGKTKETKESVEIETTLQNIIPEGALHARKHNMENTEGLTLKGIPVVDNEGEQQAEIELNEIIFTLEVTKKLEELYDKYRDYEYSLKEKDEVAIEAGKLLVELILFNTDDRTGLIKIVK